MFIFTSNVGSKLIGDEPLDSEPLDDVQRLIVRQAIEDRFAADLVDCMSDILALNNVEFSAPVARSARRRSLRRRRR
jgi:ATP-dependent Clp protease ATP-binding subunit ClpA